MRLDDDDFTLFGLPERQALDRDALDEQWRLLQARVHPDRHAGDGAAAQRVAMQWAVRVNEAYRRLRDPLRRAAYLCERRGAPIRAEDNTAMPADFLMQQMQWRDDLAEAADIAAVERLDAGIAATERAMLAEVERLLDVAGDASAAAAAVRALMFVQRFRQDVQRRLDALDTAHAR